MFHHKHHHRRGHALISSLLGHKTLAETAPGCQAVIQGYGPLPEAQQRYLRAYGLLPGRSVTVLSQHPVTIIQIEQTELALEWQVSRAILVEEDRQD